MKNSEYMSYVCVGSTGKIENVCPLVGAMERRWERAEITCARVTNGIRRRADDDDHGETDGNRLCGIRIIACAF